MRALTPLLRALPVLLLLDRRRAVRPRRQLCVRLLQGQPADLDLLAERFERIEPGSAAKLREFLSQAEYKYRVGMNDYVRRPSLSIFEFVDARIVKESVRLQMVQTMRSHVESFFAKFMKRSCCWWALPVRSQPRRCSSLPPFSSAGRSPSVGVGAR